MTSVASVLKSYKNTFVRKEKKIFKINLFNNSSPRVTVFRYFGEYHKACACFPMSVINVISVVYGRLHTIPEREQL